MRDNGIKKHFPPQEKTFCSGAAICQQEESGQPSPEDAGRWKDSRDASVHPPVFFTQTIPATKRLLILTHTQLKPVRRDNPEDECPKLPAPVYGFPFQPDNCAFSPPRPCPLLHLAVPFLPCKIHFPHPPSPPWNFSFCCWSSACFPEWSSPL